MNIEYLHDLRANHGRTSVAAFDPTGEVLVVGASKATTLWTVTGGQPPSLRATIRPGRGPRSVTTIGFHPLAPVLATNGGRVSIASFWELDPTSGLAPIEVHPWSDRRAAMASQQVGASFALAFRPSTATLATGQIRGAVRLWDVNTPARPYELGQLRVKATHVDALAFSPDGAALAVADHAGHVNVWHYTTAHATAAEPTTRLATGRTSYLAYSPDGRLLAASTVVDVAVWDTQLASTARLTRRPGVTTGMARAVAFHPRLPILACGDSQGAVSL